MEKGVNEVPSRVLVTGGGTGIGLAVVAELLQRHVSVCAVGRRLEKLAAAEALGAQIISYDITEDPSVLFTQCGEFDGLVLNAGIQIRQNICDWSRSAWAEILQTNLVGSAMLTQAFVAQCRGSGSIVGVASTLAKVPAPATAAYSASKAGLLAMLRTAALESAASGIRVNSVLPGIVDTPMIRDPSTDPSAVDPRLTQLHPLGRIGAPTEVARVIVDTLQSHWMTGAEIAIDGGLMLGTAEN